MNLKKLNFVFFVLISILFSACNNDSNDATLKAVATIKGVTVTSLGTPNSILAEVVAGEVTISSAQAVDISNTGNFITLFTPTNADATVRVVKYASGVDTTNFETDTAYANQAIKDQDFFIIEVTAQDATILYYAVNVTVTPVPSSIATVTTSAYYTVSTGGTANETIIHVLSGSNKAGFLAALTKGESHQTWTTTGINDPVLTGDTLVVTAQDGTTVVTYTITVETKAIGDSFLGGKIAYFLQAGDPGYAGIPHGIIAATSDQSTGMQWAITAYWYTAVPGGTLNTIGSGSANTDKIIAQNSAGSTYAAGLARACADGGYHDWYLPSQNELNKLYLNRVAIGNFTSHNYWSSSEFNTYFAQIQDFSDGNQPYTDKLAI